MLNPGPETDRRVAEKIGWTPLRSVTAVRAYIHRRTSTLRDRKPRDWFQRRRTEGAITELVRLRKLLAADESGIAAMQAERDEALAQLAAVRRALGVPAGVELERWLAGVR